jgi:hypothetical protein
MGECIVRGCCVGRMQEVPVSFLLPSMHAGANASMYVPRPFAVIGLLPRAANETGPWRPDPARRRISLNRFVIILVQHLGRQRQ